MDIALEESTTENVPQTLEEFIKKVSSSKTPDTIQKDYLFILLIVSMIENEFVLVNDDCEVLDHTEISPELLAKWKSPTGVYSVTLIMKSFESTPVRLVMSPLGAMAIINVIIKDFEAETYSACLPMSKYVVSPQAVTIPKIFRELKHFSMIFKSKVISPVKSRILDYHGYASASLTGLPEELLFKVLLNLPVIAVVNVSKTCMSLRDVLQSQRFWHDIFRRDFGNSDIPSHSEENWKEVYKSAYIVKRDKEIALRKATNNNMYDTYMSYPDYIISTIDPWNDVI